MKLYAIYELGRKKTKTGPVSLDYFILTNMILVSVKTVPFVYDAVSLMSLA